MHKLVIILIILKAFLISVSCLEAKDTPFQLYDSYQKYLQKWQALVENKSYIHDVTHLAMENQTCYEKKCKFFYYEYKESVEIDPNYNRTILFVSGFHGDERLGPHTLAHGYKHFKGNHIIYFPMANPSGFIKNQQKTYPSNINPYLDFPFDNNTKCYQSSAAHILDYLYRQYQIDLTIVLRNGKTHIGFDWGTMSKKYEYKTQQHDIYVAIGQVLQQIGGQNKHLYMPKFQVSSMNQRFYATRGSFSDWAYGATKHPYLLKSCKNFDYPPYKDNQMNGLVFTLQIGPYRFIRQDMGTEHGIIQENPIWRHHHGFVARSIKMLQHLTYFVFPKIYFQRTNNKISVSVKGCIKAKLQHLKVQLKNNQSSEILYELKAQQSSFPYAFELTKIGIGNKQQLSYNAQFQCDRQWQGKGKTLFATRRLYKIPYQPSISGNQILNPIQSRKNFSLNPIQQQIPSVITNFIIQKQQQQSGQIIISNYLAIILIIVIYALLKIAPKLKKLFKKEKIQYIDHFQTQYMDQEQNEDQSDTTIIIRKKQIEFI